MHPCKSFPCCQSPPRLGELLPGFVRYGGKPRVQLGIRPLRRNCRRRTTGLRLELKIKIIAGRNGQVYLLRGLLVTRKTNSDEENFGIEALNVKLASTVG